MCQESGLGPNMQTQATQFNAIYYLVVWGQDQSQSKKQNKKKQLANQTKGKQANSKNWKQSQKLYIQKDNAVTL